MIDQIKKLCRLYTITPSKSKGQNFLASQAVIDQIIAAAKLDSADTVLEVGPGLGILTQALIRTGARVVSVELDEKLFSILRSQFAGVSNLELVNQDILRFSPDRYQFEKYKIVANLPYTITSEFLKKFLTQVNPRPSTMVLMVQKEVARRICSATDASLLSLSVRLYGQPEIITIVEAKNFWPKPNVDSAVIKIDKIQSPAQIARRLGDISESQFWRLAKIGFSARRKQLQNNLAAGFKISNQRAKDLLIEANLSPTVRSQDLTVTQWIDLAEKSKIYLN